MLKLKCWHARDYEKDYQRNSVKAKFNYLGIFKFQSYFNAFTLAILSHSKFCAKRTLWRKKNDNVLSKTWLKESNVTNNCAVPLCFTCKLIPSCKHWQLQTVLMLTEYLAVLERILVQINLHHPFPNYPSNHFPDPSYWLPFTGCQKSMLFSCCHPVLTYIIFLQFPSLPYHAWFLISKCQCSSPL